MTKSAAVTDVDHDGHTDLGDQITWSFLVTNTGTTTLTTVAVDDPTAGAVELPGDNARAGCLDHLHARRRYTITQADVDAGVVSNTATASAAGPSGTPVISAPSSTDTPGRPGRRP